MKQDVYNFIFSLIFLGLAALSLNLIMVKHGGLPIDVSVFHLILLSLALFRLTRLFVYDEITAFFRDFFLDVSVHGKVTTRKKYTTGFCRCVSDVFSCPWCFSIWGGLVLLTAYFLFPGPVFFIVLLLSISAIASVLQLTANWIGWSAEYKKIKTQKEESPR